MSIMTRLADFFQDRERAPTERELADMGLFLMQDLSGYDEKAEKKAFKAGSDTALQAIINKCEAITDWQGADLHQLIADVVEELEVGFGKVGMPARLALSGQAQGPANDVIMKILGQKESIKRFQAALDYVKTKLAD